MGSISTRDAASLLEIVHDAAADVGTEPFPSRVLHALARLIPSDAFLGYEEADFTGRAIELVQIVGKPVTPALLAAFDAYGCQNPVRGCAHAKGQEVLRLSDLFNASAATKARIRCNRLAAEQD